MRRFEHPSGKFWSAYASHGQVRVSWGKIGTPGQQRDLGFASEGEAIAKLAELCAKQVLAGYVEVTDPAVVVASIKDSERWFRRFELEHRRFVEIVFDHARVEERRGSCEGDSDEGREVIAYTARSPAEAREQVMSIVRGAIAQGYVLVSDIEPPAPATPDATVSFAQNPELEAQCRAAPDNPDAWSVYTDWLLAQGDLRGELAALRASGKEREADALFRAKREELLGEDFAERVRITSWRHGFAVGAGIKAEVDEDVELEELARDFLARPIAQFVEALRFGLAGFESNNDWGPTLDVVTASPQASWIRSLRFDDFEYTDQEISWTAFGDFSQAWSRLPRLEELRIRSGQGGKLGTIVLPELKRFVRVSGGLSAAEIESICNATWPKLEHLEVWFGRAGYGAQGDVLRIRRILDGHGLPTLRHLGIVNCEFSDSLIEALARSAILPRIRTLDLSKGIMAERATADLVTHAAAFRHLASIDLAENYLLPAELERIAAALPGTEIVRGRQREREELYDDEDPEEVDDRYAALGE